jgi:hypothetical protein
MEEVCVVPSVVRLAESVVCAFEMDLVVVDATESIWAWVVEVRLSV